ncbi:MAG: hypothetical protein MK193_12940 [Lentisphaeria bacterium]|nr:hypothetical protein [Lentisphaeria bacterium]
MDAGKINVAPLVTAVLGLEDAGTAFEKKLNTACGYTIIQLKPAAE